MESLRKIKHLFPMTHKINFRSIPFLLINFCYCFYTFFGVHLWLIQLIGHDLEKHTTVYIIPQLTMYFTAKTKQ